MDYSLGSTTLAYILEPEKYSIYQNGPSLEDSSLRNFSREEAELISSYLEAFVLIDISISTLFFFWTSCLYIY